MQNQNDTTWTAEDAAKAWLEGWGIFNGNEIQRDDEVASFDSDDDALAYVRFRADWGSEFHRKALGIDRREALCKWQVKMETPSGTLWVGSPQKSREKAEEAAGRLVYWMDSIGCTWTVWAERHPA